MGRRYTSVAYMSLSYITSGFAEARLEAGKSARVERQPNGMWRPCVRAVAVWRDVATWEEAVDHVEHALAAEGVWLRRLGN